MRCRVRRGGAQDRLLRVPEVALVVPAAHLAVRPDEIRHVGNGRLIHGVGGLAQVFQDGAGDDANLELAGEGLVAGKEIASLLRTGEQGLAVADPALEVVLWQYG